MLLPPGIENPRITAIKSVEVLKVPMGDGVVLPWISGEVQKTRDYVATRIEAEGGLSAVTMDGDFKLPFRAETVDRVVAPRLVGLPLFATQRHSAILHELRPQGRFFYLSIGLWDLIGQACKVPLYRLWGAARRKVPAYASTIAFQKSPAQRARDCLAYRDRGYKAVKLRLHWPDLRDDLRLVETVRNAVGSSMEIFVDANMAGKNPQAGDFFWDLDRAIATAKELERLGVGWLEEPLQRGQYQELSRLAASTTVPIAGGEGDLGLPPFHQYIHHSSYDILQPDPAQSGSIDTLRKITAMAEGAALPVTYHHGKSGVGMHAALHMSASAANCPWLEVMDDPGAWNPTGFQVGYKPLELDAEGCIVAPETPGLGIAWDPDFLRQHGLAGETGRSG